MSDLDRQSSGIHAPEEPEESRELKSSKERLSPERLRDEAARTYSPDRHIQAASRKLLTDAAEEIERLNVQWEKAARLLNEFRPVTGTDEWVAVRVGALNYVLMTASPTPAVGPLVPESRDG